MATSPRLIDDGGPVEVDVGPAQPEQLAAAHAGHGRQPQSREQAVPGGGPQERRSCSAVQACCSTLGIDRSRGAWATRATLRVMSPRRTASVEGAADDEVDLVDGLGRERPAPSAGCSIRSYSVSRWWGRSPRSRMVPRAGRMWRSVLWT